MVRIAAPAALTNSSRRSLSHAQFVDDVDGGLDMLDRRGRQDAVPKIEHMSVAARGTAQDVLDTTLDFMEGGVERDRIEVPLDGAIMPDHGPSLIEVNAPIHPDDISARFTHLPQDRGRTGAKMDHGHAFALQSGKNQLHMRFDVFRIITGRKTADPAIEELNGLSSGPDLPPADSR